jgi:hypothetical protein
MSDCDLKFNVLPDVDETLANITGLPEELSGDPRRQAVPSFHGDAYQAWWSIDAWLRLTDANEVIYLEGAEDFDFVGHKVATTVQVKDNAGTISLGSAKARKALENFWTLSHQEVHRRIYFHYLTTSSVAKEQDGDFGGAKGIEVWRAAQTNSDLAIQVSRYLATKLDVSSPLGLFLNSSEPQLVQEHLIKRFHWLTDQQDLAAVKRSVTDRITILLSEQHHPLALVSNVQKNLESKFWEILLEPLSARRCLNRAELLRQVEAATITYLPVPVGQLPTLIANTRLGAGLLNLFLDRKAPKPPELLLLRRTLTQCLEELIKQRKVVLLTGTVYKGKTTVAQLVSATLCPEAWWVNLTGRQPDQVDNLLLALASKIESGNCPSLIVIDDLDIGPTAHRAYRDSLALVLYRASAGGRGIILTARGASSNSAIIHDFNDLVLLEVPELSSEEIEALCIEHGCPKDNATFWGFLVSTRTGGHPKLVQVQLAELAAHGWPKPSPTDVTTLSPAVTSARQMARQLLSYTESPPIAEFVYLVSECSVLMHRSVAIQLAESVPGLTNGGDILDSLTGKWLERLEDQWYRTTTLLSGIAAEVWSAEKRKKAHIRLYDAILSKRKFDPSEAAALLFHAYIGGEPWRLAHTAMLLQRIDGEEASRLIERQLFWLPFVALEAGQSITDDAMAGAILRVLQFRVASTLDVDYLPQICARWADDIEKIGIPEAKILNRAMMSLFIGFAESTKVPLKSRLESILEIQIPPSEILENLADFSKRFFDSGNTGGVLPEGGTITQVMLFNASRCFLGLGDLRSLLQWLDNMATEEIRQQFDAMLEWPVVQSLGAFVQSAWAAVHEQTKDWEPWIALLERVEDYAKRRGSPRFGREAVKARATILTEYLDRGQEALKALDWAEAEFGQSTVLMEQRANVFFHAQKDESVLEIWNQLTSDPDNSNILDPYAYRRAGMSAARLKKWEKAEQIFNAAADSIQPGAFELTKFGLRVDAALSVSLRGDQTAAAMLLADAVLALPAEAGREGDERWEAVQLAAVEVCRTIENSIWKQSEAKAQFDPGYSSSPDLKVSKVNPGQAARREMTQVQILCLAATLSKDPVGFAKELEILAGSRYFSVRWIAVEAQLALAYSTGAGAGFVETLLAFDRATTDFLAKMQRGLSLIDPDDGPDSDLLVAPERWFGLLCAGIVCSGKDLLAHLNIWLDASIRMLGKDAALTNNIHLLIDGVTLPAESLQSTINSMDSPSPMRCGATAQLLQEMQPAQKTLHLQVFLTSGLVCDESFSRQALFNLHVARCFADVWRVHAQSPFQFYSPSLSVPALLAAIDGVEHGSATLQSILRTAADALGQPLGEFMDRVR